jgi:hypothetical protein
MSIFGGKRGPKLTIEEKFVADLDDLVGTATEAEIRDLADRIYAYIPVIVSQATAPEMLLAGKLKAVLVSSGKKLIWHAGSPIETLKALFHAIETHGPNIHRIFLEQAQRHKRHQAQLAELHRQEREPIEAEVVSPRLLEPAR